MNIYRDIATFLNEKGIENYSITQHQGKCLRPFVIIEDGGEQKEKGYTIKIKNIDIVVVYPTGKYSELEDYVYHVIDTMKDYTRATFSENISDVMIDTDKDAYVVSLEYKIYKGI